MLVKRLAPPDTSKKDDVKKKAPRIFTLCAPMYTRCVTSLETFRVSLNITSFHAKRRLLVKMVSNIESSHYKKRKIALDYLKVSHVYFFIRKTYIMSLEFAK